MPALKYLNVAQEAIAFQGDGFHKELTLLIQPYIENSNTRVELDKLSSDLTKVIRKRINADVGIVIDRWLPMMLLCDSVDINALFSQYSKMDEEAVINPEVIQKMTVSSGFVDLELSKLNGYFSKRMSAIGFSPDYISSGKFTAEEISALILHELGHLFGICEMLDRTAGTNQILVTIDRALRNTTDVKKREMILRYGGSALGLNERVIVDLEKTTNDTIATTILISESTKNMFLRSDQRNTYYESITIEYMADEFAARHGAGKALVTSLDKHNGYSFQKRNPNAYLYMEIIKAAAVIVGSLTNPFILALGLAVSFFDRSHSEEPIYDNPLARLNRIRNQFVEQAKQPGLPSNVTKQLLVDVKVVDSLLTEYRDQKDWLTYLVDCFKSSRTSNRIDQQRLEKLALNDLFLKALEFKQI